MNTKCGAKDPSTCRYHGTSVSKKKQTPVQSSRQTGDKGYKCEIIFMNAFIALSNKDNTELDKQTENFLNLPLSSRTTTLVNISSAEGFKEVLQNLESTLKTSLDTSELKLTNVKNNRQGSDLEENITNTSVELKLGSETAVNAGLALVKDIFNEEVFSLFPSSEDRITTEKIFTPEKESLLLAAQKQKLLVIKDEINKKFKGKPLSPLGQFILNSYFKGITSLQEIKSSYNASKATSNDERKVRKYTLMSNGTWVETTRKGSTDTHEKVDIWVVKEAIFNQGSEKDRLNIFIENDNIGYGFKLVLNGKNNGKKFNTKTPAKLLLNSFNCWFYSLGR